LIQLVEWVRSREKLLVILNTTLGYMEVIFFCFLDILGDGLSGEKSKWEFEVFDLSLVTLEGDVRASDN